MGNLKNMHAMRNNVVKFCVEIMRPFGRALSGELAVFRVDTRQRTSTLFPINMTTQSVTLRALGRIKVSVTFSFFIT